MVEQLIRESMGARTAAQTDGEGPSAPDGRVIINITNLDALRPTDSESEQVQDAAASAQNLIRKSSAQNENLKPYRKGSSHQNKQEAAAGKKQSKARKNAAQLQQMLQKPTNNFGLAQLFKNFVFIDENYQLEQCAMVQHHFIEKLDRSLEEADDQTFNQYLRLCKRISYECPIEYIADTFFRLLVKYENEALSSVEISEDPISTFFSLQDCPKVLNLPSDVDPISGDVIRTDHDFDIQEVFCAYGQTSVPLKSILDDLFFEHGRIRPHERTLCWFPKYLQFYADSCNSVIGRSSEDSDVLRLDQKLYLAIMAVSCYHCDYLLNILEEQFVLEGGDLTWITEGLAKVEPRLARFSELNEIMAFRPWTIATNHLQRVMQSDENGTGWSVAQLVKGVMVLAHYHGLCSFVLGQGLTEDSSRVLELITLQKNNSAQRTGSVTPQKLGEVSDADSFAIHALKHTPVRETDHSYDSSSATNYDEDTDWVQDSPSRPSGSDLESSSAQGSILNDGTEKFSIHRANVMNAYMDFVKNRSGWHVLAQFNWEDHAFSVLNKYDQRAASCINRQSEFAMEMTNNKYGSEPVESTFPMRNGIVKYLMHIHGIVDKYYDYANINYFLHPSFKGYIKKMMCDPQSISLSDLTQTSTLLTPEERCHVCILVMETKKRVELIYVTKVLSQLTGS